MANANTDYLMNQKITIHDLPPGLNGKGGLKRMHHHQYAKIRDSWHYKILAEKPRKHKDGVRVVYTRHSVRRMDLDNVGASFKVVGDALESTGVIKDDSPEILTELVLRSKKVSKRKQQRIEIEIEDV